MARKKMSKEEKEIAALEREQLKDDFDILEPLGLGEQLCELDYYPEDEFEQVQRIAEYGIIDPLHDFSDE